MLAFCHSAHLFPSVFLGCLTSVSVQTQVALVIRALDCDHAQPRTGHQIWSQASQVKSKSKQFSADIRSCVLMRRTRTSMQRKRRSLLVGLPKDGARGITPEVDERKTLVEDEEAALREKESCEEVQ